MNAQHTVRAGEEQAEPLTVVIVGAGPRGTGVLERLLANAGELVPDRPVRVELVDPYPPGAGRVWREQQSELMLMNATAENVTIFTDESVKCAGPIRPGPSLSEWAAAQPEDLSDATGMNFASRHVQGRYLAWVLDRIVAEAPPNVTVEIHATAAVRADRTPEGRQRIWLADRPTPLLADALVLALGHLDVEPDKDDLWMADFAGRHGLRFLPPSYTVDTALDVLRAGETVAVRGFGLAFVDMMVLLTEGRGGRYVEEEDGELRYVPSGNEPILYVGSRRGVPYRAKMSYRLAGAPAAFPRFFDAATIDARFGYQRRLDFYADLWPFMAKEIGWGYYHELFTAHPERTRVSWPDFAEVYSALEWDTVEMRTLIEACVPEPDDRFDVHRLDRPLTGERFADLDEVQQRVDEHIAADLSRRSDRGFSADLGAFLALLSVHGQLPEVLADGKLRARPHVQDLTGWWSSFFEYYGSGPPGPRIRQLLALARAGVVRFLGAGMWVAADEDTGRFRAGSLSTEDTVEATALVEARLPNPTLRNTVDTLLRGLYEDGCAVEHVFTDEEDDFEHSAGVLSVCPKDFRIVDRTGNPQPGRYALGPYTSVRHFAAFARPGVNALSFRQNDMLARGLLTELVAGPESAAA